MSKFKLGIDIGGTKIYAVVLDENYKVVGKSKTDTPIDKPIETTAKLARETAKKAVKKAKQEWQSFNNAGVATPGAINPKTGLIRGAHNLGWIEEPVKKVFTKMFRKEIFLGNDVNCGVLAEAKAGAGKNFNSVIGFFPKTKLKKNIILNKKLIKGAHGLAGEFGHSIIKTYGRKCPCGKRGCLEAYCSKKSFSKTFDKFINQKGKKSLLSEIMGNDFSRLKSSAIAKAYKNNDELVISVINKGAVFLGVGAASIAAVLDPDCIVFGGGVIEALGDLMMPVIKESFNKNLFGNKPEDIKLKISVLGDDAVAMGAAFLIG